MSPRPAIFISAVSKELRSARQLVSNTLTFLGYEPEWQDVFSTEEGDLRGMLRRRIDACKGVVQLVGQCYGAEPPAPDEQFGRVSYSQYEALYARQMKKKVWYLILDDDFATDPHEAEAPELRDLQSAYRARVQSENLLHHPLANRHALEANVLKLRDELTRLRRGVKQWAAGVALLLLLSVGLGFWLLQRQQSTSRQIAAQNQQLAAMNEKMEKLLKQGTLQLPEVQSKVRQEQSAKADPAEVQQRTYETLAKQLGVDAGVLREKLPKFADHLRNDPNASAFERASAAYVAKDYNEAERLALVAADEATKAGKMPDAIKALDLAGISAEARIEYAKALQHFRAAAQLTDRTRDSMEWAEQQWNVAHALEELGNYGEAAAAYREAVTQYQRARGEEDQDVLALRNNFANMLRAQGKYAEAEAQHREVLKLREKTLGPEHPDTLQSRVSLGNVLQSQERYAEAETQNREVLRVQAKLHGLEHPDTLAIRNNLAIALRGQGKYAEAEAELRDVVKLRQKVLGPEHPDTLASQNNFANALRSQDKFAEAEAQHREVLKVREKVLGPEHPDTLGSRNNLAVLLDDQGKFAEAEVQFREVLKLRDKVLGPEHPDTLQSLNNLTTALRGLGRFAEAEAHLREVIHLREKILGPKHPDIFRSCHYLALCLKSEMKIDEARAFARRAAEGAAKVLGPTHPYTLEYQKLWQELQKQ